MIPRYHPQVGIRDICRALYSEADDDSILLPGLDEKVKPDCIFALNGATAGLTIILKALGLAENSKVAVPVYSCVSVFEAVAAAGLKCIFIDTDPDTFSFDMESLKENSDQIDAVIPIHTFGYPGNIDAIKKILPGRPIIEDCTHALGSYSDTKPPGLDGAAGVFSFNYHKPISVGGGGVLIVNDPACLEKVKEIIKTFVISGGSFSFKSLVRHMVISTLYRKPWYGLLAFAHLLELRRDGALQFQVELEKISRLDRRLVNSNIQREFFRFDRQRNFAGRISRILEKMAPLSNFIEAKERWNGYICPIIVESPTICDKSLDYFTDHNIDAFVLWPECLRTAARFGYKKGQCPRLENTIKRLFMLPCYAELTDSQQLHICDVVAKWKSKIDRKAFC